MVNVLICSPFVTFGGVERVILNRIHCLAALELPFRFQVFFSADFGADQAFHGYVRNYGLDEYCGRIAAIGDCDADLAIVIDAPETIPLIPDDIPLIVECHAPYPDNRRYLRDPRVQKRIVELWVPSDAFMTTISLEVPELAELTSVMPDFVVPVSSGRSAVTEEAHEAGAVYLGRMDYMKDVSEAMRIADLVRKTSSREIRFRACGVLSDPKVASYLGSLTDSSWVSIESPIGFSETATFLDSERKARSVFISASQGESFGMSAAEAMAAGLPVLLSDIPAHHQLVQGDERMLYDRGDVEGAASKLDYLLNEGWDVMSGRCLQYAVKFGPTAFVDQWLAGMERVAGQQGASLAQRMSKEVAGSAGFQHMNTTKAPLPQLRDWYVRAFFERHTSRHDISLLSQQVTELERRLAVMTEIAENRERGLNHYADRISELEIEYAHFRVDKEHYIAKLLEQERFLRRWSFGIPAFVELVRQARTKFHGLVKQHGMIGAIRQFPVLAGQALWRQHESNALKANPYHDLLQLKPIAVEVTSLDYEPIDQGGVSFSCVTTVRNEAVGIADFIESVLRQSQQADELLIVDGGSSDGTTEIVRNLVIAHQDRITLIEAGSVNIAKGRNIGIEAARNEIIVLIDAGCRLAPGFFANMMGSWRDHPHLDLVSGIYHACQPGDAAKRFIYDWDGVVDWQNFLPSARAVSIRKSLWRKIGGFPEYLTLTGEDTLFDVQYRRCSNNWLINKKAAVFWDAPTSREAGDTLAYRYGVGDGESGFGDFRNYRELVDSLHHRGGRGITQHARGYLDGRAMRAEIEVMRRGVAGLVAIFSMRSFAEPSRLRDAAMVLADAGHKIVYVSASSASPQAPVYLDVDYTLLELYALDDFVASDLVERYGTYESLPVTVLVDCAHRSLGELLDVLRKGFAVRLKVVFDAGEHPGSQPGYADHSRTVETELMRGADLITTGTHVVASRLKADFGCTAVVVADPSAAILEISVR